MSCILRQMQGRITMGGGLGHVHPHTFPAPPPPPVAPTNMINVKQNQNGQSKLTPCAPTLEKSSYATGLATEMQRSDTSSFRHARHFCPSLTKVSNA